MCGSIHVDVANCVNVFMNEREVRGCLKNLKRIRHVHESRHAGQEAPGFRVRGRAVSEVLLFFLRGPWLVGDDVALDDTLPCRNVLLRRVTLNIPRGRVHHLPDAR